MVHLDKYPQLCDLDLADPPGKNAEIVDLIRSNHYWDIVLKENIHTEGSPMQ